MNYHHVRRLHKHNASSSIGGEEHDPQFYSHNVLFVMFHQPVAVAVVRFFNYSKSPKRGVKYFGIEVDHRVVYMGNLEAQDSRCAYVFLRLVILLLVLIVIVL